MKYFLSSIIIAISGWLIAANVHDLSVDSNGDMTAITKDGSSEKYYTAKIFIKAADNTYETGNIKGVMIGDMVTITSDAVLGHPSSVGSSAGTTVGFVPVEFRPTADINNVYYNNSGRIFRVEIRANGQIVTEYRDMSGTLGNESDTQRAISASYVK